MENSWIMYGKLRLPFFNTFRTESKGGGAPIVDNILAAPASSGNSPWSALPLAPTWVTRHKACCETTKPTKIITQALVVRPEA